MVKFEHTKIIEKLTSLDELPSDKERLLTWVKAGDHVQFLIENARSQEIVVYAAPEYSFIHSLAVPEDLLKPLDKDDLMKWRFHPWHNRSTANYTSGGGRDGLWVEHEGSDTGSKIPANRTHLIFARTFEGWSGEDRHYFELSQEYAHLENLHLRPEHHGYCKFDKNGDLVPIVSITKHSSETNISLVTFDWSSLECYLAASNQVLVRLFNFTLLNRANFKDRGNEEPREYDLSDELFYKQTICGPAAWTRGVQIIRPRRQKSKIFSEIKASWYGEEEKNHVEFIASDFRNKCTRKISTSPNATTNYFQAKNNNLPYEVSPAFFRPEVLLKYKADRDKYTLGERDLRCRASWFLEAFDVNKAGQVFAYICYLRQLPETELLHWLSYNEKPKAPISKRAFINDFQGNWVSFTDPLEEIKNIVRTWDGSKYSWWSLRSDRLLDNVTIPLTASRDEWADSFLTLTQLVNEGFVVKSIRERLKQNQIGFDKEEKSLSLLERLIGSPDKKIKLTGLREAQLIRTKAKAHSAGNDAEELAMTAVKDHGSHAAHFRYVCKQIQDELVLIQDSFI